MASGASAALELTEAYLRRIDRLDPLLHAVIETNPAALDIAARRDAERRAGRRPRAAARDPRPGQGQHRHERRDGDDRRLAGARRQPRPARRADRGAPARRPARSSSARPTCPNGRTSAVWSRPAVTDAGLHLNGWSARGGFTRNPYGLGRDPCGSSSGSAVAPGRQPVRGRDRHRDRRLDRLPVGAQRDRRAQADGRAGRPGRHHPDLAQPGHGRADGPDRDRRRDHAQRPALAVRRGRRPSAAARLPAASCGRARCAARGSASIGGCSSGDGADAGLNEVAERAFDDDGGARGDARRPDRPAGHDRRSRTPS